MTYPEIGKLLEVHVKKDDTKQPKRSKKCIPIWRSFIFDNTGVQSPNTADMLLGRSGNRYSAVIKLYPAPAGTSQGNTQVVQSFNNPAVGTNFTYTNTTGKPQTLISANGILTTDAVVANRFPLGRINDASGNTLWQDTDGSAVLASSVVNLHAFQGATHLNSPSGSVTLALPLNMAIPPGGTFSFAATLDAGDQWSSINMTFSNITNPYGWIGESLSQVQNQKGMLALPGSNPFTLYLEGTEEVWFAQDPTSTEACLVSVVGFYEH